MCFVYSNVRESWEEKMEGRKYLAEPSLSLRRESMCLDEHLLLFAEYASHQSDILKFLFASARAVLVVRIQPTES